jgi:hypothetical protein
MALPLGFVVGSGCFGNQSEVSTGARSRGRSETPGSVSFKVVLERVRVRFLGNYTGGKEGGKSERGVDGFQWRRAEAAR